jgi:precorrin-2 dehydrogenase / sirohydrochlorin ferrochelatase
LLIDLKLDKKTVIVVGGGAEAYRKTQSFVDSGANIWVISRDFSHGIQKLCEEKKVALLKTEIQNAKTFIESLNPKPDVFLAATNNPKLNLELIKSAKSVDCMVYSVDNPALSDFILPAVAKVGDVKIAVSTGGKSPAMARVLRQRIEKLVTTDDLLEIELQAKIRSIIKEKVSDSKIRSKMLHEILNSDKIKQSLRKGNLQEAEESAMKLEEETQK